LPSNARNTVAINSVTPSVRRRKTAVISIAKTNAVEIKATGTWIRLIGPKVMKPVCCCAAFISFTCSGK
jgi:hypothetical protein